jgi:hypothetical protein
MRAFQAVARPSPPARPSPTRTMRTRGQPYPSYLNFCAPTGSTQTSSQASSRGPRRRGGADRPVLEHECRALSLLQASHQSFNAIWPGVQCKPDCPASARAQTWPPTCCCLSQARRGKRVQPLFRNNYSARRWSLSSANYAAETDCSSEMARYRCNPSE